MSLIKPNIHNQIYYYLFIVLVFVLPVHERLVPPVIALIALNWIFEFNLREKFRRVKYSRLKKYLLSFSILYLLYFIGLFYSENIYGYSGGALFNLEKRMSLFVFPLLFSTIDMDEIKEKLFKQIQKAFITGCLLSSFFLVNNAFFEFIQTNDTSVFYYSNLSEFHHPSYLALYYSFTIAILLNWQVKVKNTNPSKRNAVFVLIFLFQVMIVLLSSKAGILGMAIVYIFTIIYILIPGNNIKNVRVLTPLILLIVFLLTLFLNPNSYRRFYSVEKAVEQDIIDNSKHTDGTVSRIFVWQSSLEIIKEHPLFGVGIGDVKQKLLGKYKEKNITHALELELNAHNEYLQTFMAIGVTGFLVLALSLLIPGWFAFRRKKLLYLLFLVLFALHLLVESMLAKQAGVVFYAFFNALLFYMAFSGRLEPRKEKSKKCRA